VLSFFEEFLQDFELSKEPELFLMQVCVADPAHCLCALLPRRGTGSAGLAAAGEEQPKGWQRVKSIPKSSPKGGSG